MELLEHRIWCESIWFTIGFVDTYPSAIPPGTKAQVISYNGESVTAQVSYKDQLSDREHSITVECTSDEWITKFIRVPSRFPFYFVCDSENGILTDIYTTQDMKKAVSHLITMMLRSGDPSRYCIMSRSDTLEHEPLSVLNTYALERNCWCLTEGSKITAMQAIGDTAWFREFKYFCALSDAVEWNGAMAFFRMGTYLYFFESEYDHTMFLLRNYNVRASGRIEEAQPRISVMSYQEERHSYSSSFWDWAWTVKTKARQAAVQGTHPFHEAVSTCPRQPIFSDYPQREIWLRENNSAPSRFRPRSVKG